VTRDDRFPSESPESRLDHAIDRALASVSAEADPEPWRRARARLEARPHVPRGIAWATRPRALAFSLALFVASVTLSWALARTALERADEDTSLADATQLAFEAGSVESLLPTATTTTTATTVTPAPGAASDTGSTR